MTLHKDLAGADLHEPKGIAAATSGQVYIANGSGTGAWTSKNADVINTNVYTLDLVHTDIASTTEKLYFYVATKSKILNLVCIVNAVVDANTVLTVYNVGVLMADSLTLTAAGSAIGTKFTSSTFAANTIVAGSVVEVRSDGAATGVSKATIALQLQAIP